MHSDDKQLARYYHPERYQGVMKDEDNLQDILSDDEAYHSDVGQDN